MVRLVGAAHRFVGIHREYGGRRSHDRPGQAVGEELYRKQVVKQADLVLAMWLRGDAFSPEQKVRNVAYYEPLAVRDSSLSSGVRAVLSAEVGHLELAYDYFAEAALADLYDLHHNVAQGLHIASLAGAWITTVAGFGGMRDHNGELTFAPRLPPELSGISFRMCVRDCRICITIHADKATYELVRGELVRTSHHGTPITLTQNQPITLPIPPPPPNPAPHRPPAHRGPTISGL
ncbi:glycosyl hydrolase family 65 protein [Saccharopolyspora soli]|uniref:glycosyl hydrolase family 65 protein n=1 Tax=Saccharopolyspora soli TaxID=2926618 RepID=UPI003558D167